MKFIAYSHHQARILGEQKTSIWSFGHWANLGTYVKEGKNETNEKESENGNIYNLEKSRSAGLLTPNPAISLTM